jgi:hypothetical protein
MATTEVVLFGKLGENEVVGAADFGKNQRKKLCRSEHPTQRATGAKRSSSQPIAVKFVAANCSRVRRNIIRYTAPPNLGC